MKAIKATLAGREQYLVFTGEAMFQIQEKFGGASELIEKMKGGTREAFSATYEAAAILAEQGELARRYLGYESSPMVSAEQIAATTTPGEVIKITLAVSSAIALGYGREIQEESDEVDLGLAELNAQKKTS